MEFPRTARKAERKCDPCRIAKQKCNPIERIWDGKTQQSCARCTRVNLDCGPNLSQFETDITKRGQKRKAKQSVDHDAAQAILPAIGNLGTSGPNVSRQDDASTTQAAPGIVAPFASGNDNTEPELTPRVKRHGSLVNAISMLETANELLSNYQYINHPKQTISLLGESALPEAYPTHRQKEVSAYLAIKIDEELAGVVQKVSISHHSAEHVLLLAKEAVCRFRRLANDSEALREVEYEILDKRVRLLQHCISHHGTQGEIISVSLKGHLFHQYTLGMERNELNCKVKPSSRSISPEVASTASSDTSAGSKRTARQASGPFFSKETRGLLTDSSLKSQISHYIALRSFARSERLRGKEREEFPALHTALLFGQEPQARSWVSWLESNDDRVHLVDFFKRNAAHVAAERGRVHLLTALLPGHRKSLDNPDAFGLTPLMIAVLHGHLRCAKLLVGAAFKHAVRDASCRNLLSIACARRHFHIVKYLINELQFPPDDMVGGCFCSPIHDAIESGDLQICEFLINSGADVNQYFNNKTPVELALEKGHASIFQLIDERTRLSWNQVDPVSAHLGFQHVPNLRYGPEDDINRSMSQPYDRPGQAYNTTSHPSHVSYYQSVAANTQYLHPG